MTQQQTTKQTAKKQNALPLSNMITQTERDELLKHIEAKRDFGEAALIYKEKTGRKIGPRYLYKFITGERKCFGKKAGSHQPLDMYQAIVEAIEKRRRETEQITSKAAGYRRERLAA